MIQKDINDSFVVYIEGLKGGSTHSLELVAQQNSKFSGSDGSTSLLVFFLEDGREAYRSDFFTFTMKNARPPGSHQALFENAMSLSSILDTSGEPALQANTTDPSATIPGTD